MAKFTLEELYYGDKYDIMGHTAAELLLRGTGDDDQTKVELCLVKHTLLAAQRIAQEGDEAVTSVNMPGITKVTLVDSGIAIHQALRYCLLLTKANQKTKGGQLMNLKGMKTIHTETINGVRYTTVSYFNGDVDLRDKIGQMIAELFNATALNETITEDQLPTEKAG